MASADHDAMMAQFMDDYLLLLDNRLAAIKRNLDARDDMSANVSLLSLESSSSMVGAKELASIVCTLRGAVERHERQHVPALVQAMTNEAERVRGSMGWGA